MNTDEPIAAPPETTPDSSSAAGPGTENFAEMLAAASGAPGQFTPGEGLVARVVSVGDEWVFIDVGAKGEAIIDRRELSGDSGRLSLEAGDSVRVWFVGTDGEGMKFTTKAGTGPGADSQLRDAFEGQLRVEGLVVAEIKGGYEVRLGETRAFCPYSQMDLRRVERPADHLGQHYDFVIGELSEDGRNVVLSRRPLLEAEQKAAREAAHGRIKEGMTLTGRVTNVRPFGAFVDLGGIEGLIPISEVGWSRTEDINTVLTTGQEVTVAVKLLDPERDRITLSLRDTQTDPWEARVAELRPGSVLTGTVVRLAQFGAFVRLAEGVDGLIHISRLGGGKRLKHPKEAVKEGQKLEVRVEAVDRDKKRISLVPADFEDTDEGARALQEYQQKAAVANTQSMGTLGDLLKAKLETKKR